MSEPFLLYGSYGYTGALIAEQAARHGMRPILSGRDARRLQSQANQIGLEFHPMELDDTQTLEVALKKVPLVLNCAGPFAHTFQPLVEACLQLGRHYLDITGEIVVLEALAALDNQARQARVMLLPAVGFDVVPSDCLAVHLKQRLPEATHLTMAIKWSGGGFSRGTALTAIEHLSQQGAIRKAGKLLAVPLLRQNRQVDFGQGARDAVGIPWADLSTAYYSTGIPDIETYITLPKSVSRMLGLMRPFLSLASNRLTINLLKKIIGLLPPGPTAEARKNGRSKLWGEVSDGLGQRASSLMETPDGYDLTASTALGVVERVLSGEFTAGFQTPAMAYGADFILEFPGVKREDVNTE